MGQACSKLCSDGQSKPQKEQESETIDLIKNTPRYESLNNQNQNQHKIQSIAQPKAKDQVSYKDFEKLDNLGEGAYGNVILVKKTSNNKVFAMKIIKKSKIMEQSLNRKMLIEKNVLLENKHPFIVRLKYSFQTDKKLYLVMEFCHGGELYSYIARHKKFPIEIAKFVGAEVLLGLEYLHNKMKIMYRDLKPENILITEDGHIKITDFGLGKQITSEDQLTHSFLGTPEYIAPEIIKCKQSFEKQGYTLKCDIWAFGIFLYELIHGQPPFTNPQRNWAAIMKLILANNPQFNDDFNEESKDLIKKCLNNDPKARPSWQEIRNHSFFLSIDWEGIYMKKYESPLKQYITAKKEKLQRPKPILETPVNEFMDLPNIKGFTYDPQTLPNKISQF